MIHIIKQRAEIIIPEGFTLDSWLITQLKLCETAGRNCWRSEDKITDTSYIDFLNRIYDSGHTSVLENAHITVRYITDRATANQLVRHRIGVSYAQESQRYVNYTKEKHGNGEIQFILPSNFEHLYDFNIEDVNLAKYNEKELKSILILLDSYGAAAHTYKNLISSGSKPEEARFILPNGVKTEIVATYNLRSLINLFDLRGPKNSGAQLEIRNLMIDLNKNLTNVENLDNFPKFFRKFCNIVSIN